MRETARLGDARRPANDNAFEDAELRGLIRETG